MATARKPRNGTATANNASKAKQADGNAEALKTMQSQLSEAQNAMRAAESQATEADGVQQTPEATQAPNDPVSIRERIKAYAAKLPRHVWAAINPLAYLTRGHGMRQTGAKQAKRVSVSAEASVKARKGVPSHASISFQLGPETFSQALTAIVRNGAVEHYRLNIGLIGGNEFTCFVPLENGDGFDFAKVTFQNIQAKIEPVTEKDPVTDEDRPVVDPVYLAALFCDQSGPDAQQHIADLRGLKIKRD